MPLTDEQRQLIINAAKEWVSVGTPYRDCACAKGIGVDCGQLIKGVFLEAGFQPEDNVPLPQTYSTSIWLHKADTVYIDTIQKYFREISEAELKPGDVVIYKMGHGYAHGAIVVDWPHHIIHALPTRRGVTGGVRSGDATALKWVRRERKCFTLRDEFCGGKEVNG